MAYYTPEDVVERHTGFAKVVARRSCDRLHPFEDMFQECLIGLWKASCYNPGKSLDGGLYSKAMRGRMANLKRGPGERGHIPWFGAPPVKQAHGRACDAFSGETAYLDSMATNADGTEDGFVNQYLIEGSLGPEERFLEEEFTRQIRAATSSYRLSLERERDRQILDLFMEGRTGVEIGKEMGVTHQAISRRLKIIKEALRVRLQPLLDA